MDQAMDSLALFPDPAVPPSAMTTTVIGTLVGRLCPVRSSVLGVAFRSPLPVQCQRRVCEQCQKKANLRCKQAGGPITQTGAEIPWRVGCCVRFLRKTHCLRQRGFDSGWIARSLPLESRLCNVIDYLVDVAEIRTERRARIFSAYDR